MSQLQPSTILSSFNSKQQQGGVGGLGFKSSGFQGLSLPLHSISSLNSVNNPPSTPSPINSAASGGSESGRGRERGNHHRQSSSHDMDQTQLHSSRSRTSSIASGFNTPTAELSEFSFGFTERTSYQHDGKKRDLSEMVSNLSSDRQQGGDELEILKRQLESTKERYDTFRKGFILERNQRLKTVHDLYKFTKKMEILQKQLFEKDTALLALSTENVKLKEDIYEIHKFGVNSTMAQPSNNNQPTAAASNKDNSDSGSKRRLFFSRKRNMSTDSADNSKNSLSNENLKQVVNMDFTDKTESPKAGNNESKLDAIQEMKHWRELYRKTQNDLKKREKQISDLQSQEHVQKQMLQEIQAKYRNTEGNLSKSQEAITSLKSQLFEREQSHLNLSKENDLLQQQLSEYQKWKEDFLEDYQNMEQTVANLKEEIERKDLDLLRLTEKCMELKEQLNSVRLQIRKFRCKRISQGGLANKLMGSVTKSDAAIVLHKNPQNGILWIDIKIRTGKDQDRSDFNAINSNIVQSHPLTSITDIVPDVHDPKRFSIYFFSNATASPSKNTPNSVIETFECTSESERTETMQSIQEFISIAAQAFD
ncbi:predicted protein [Naegleria gruberi]|uniref:Predicted protein n=1 Tax=Naegleria gruberi TaxID=5762 RepID=D2VKH6_NAEGR|nr:uncharacterized protein NAEGRDRAFT_69396 [Naegleria gruberi]EFC42598.1 predicted protein [Naegleria gruberi]|eukprot:XP_002675342.1 predicted protein [Naegleria gruberi strain NEG-M]